MILIKIVNPFVLLLVLFQSIDSFSLKGKDDSSNLMLVQLLFRHGDRTPIALYPTDPYINFTFPEGMGQLTKYGKKRLYGYGKALRQRYSNYIKKLPLKNVEAYSSPLRRCIETNQLVLAGMFPPEGPWSDTDELSQDWVPIAVHTVEPDRSWLLNAEAKCSKANAFEKKMVTEPNLKKLLEEKQVVIRKIFAATYGSNETYWRKLAWLHDTMKVEAEYFTDKFIFPKWLLNVSPTPDEALSILKYVNDLQFYSPGYFKEYIKLRTGLLLNRLISNMKQLGGVVPAKPEDRKLFTFSSHDTFISYVMHALGIFKGQPGYGSGLIFELRQHSDFDPEPFVHIYYANVPKNNEITALNLSESKVFSSLCWDVACPLSKFAEALKDALIASTDDVQRLCKLK